LLLWAAASVGYSGELRVHRGYNVAWQPPTLTGEAQAIPHYMMGYFDACYFGCAPCGESCAIIDVSHNAWQERQYFMDRVASASGALALAEDPQLCASASAGQLTLAGCANADAFDLEPDGHLVVGGGQGVQCAAADDAGNVTLATCGAMPGQYWLLDSEGDLWSGVPITSPMLTTYTHARCLRASDAAGAALAAPICGYQSTTHWSLGP
jgi:hypothetical protein